MKNSIQRKIVLLILVGIFCSSLTIGGLGILSFREELQKSVVSTMNLICREKAEGLNAVLGRLEESTSVLGILATNRLVSVESLKDETYRQEYMEHMKQVGYDIAKNTEGALGSYLRLNPEIAGSTEGFYWMTSKETNELVLEPNTDITKYSKDEREHVGWYYEPVEAGKPVWMEPYINQNTNRKIVSYTMPIYKEGSLIGVVGMDIDWNYIIEMIEVIQVYETGYTFLTDEDFCVLYSQEFATEEQMKNVEQKLKQVPVSDLIRSDMVYDLEIDGEARTAAVTSLSNGKYIGVIAPTKEVYNKDFHALGSRMVIMTLLISALFVLVTMQIAKTIIRPLKELDKAAKDIANGNLDVELDIKSDDEVGDLAQSFRETARQLKIKIEYINNLAYSDKLTGVKNNTAYLHDVVLLKTEIQEKQADFSVFIIDANGLKHINDTYGHEAGNELIIKVTQMIAEVFGEEHLYRIGGDEFAVILHNTTEEDCEKYKKQFLEVLDNQKGKMVAIAAIGSATYHKNMDSTYESVFNRSDEDMFVQKQIMKQEGRVSRFLE